MGYSVFDASGTKVAGDENLDEAVRGAALLVNGWVEDESGQAVYTSPARQEALQEQQRIADEQEQRQQATGSTEAQ